MLPGHLHTKTRIYTYLPYRKDTYLYMSILQDKTRLFATNRLEFLGGADKIVVMKEGRIDGQGSQAELQDTCDTFKDLMANMGTPEQGAVLHVAKMRVSGQGGGGYRVDCEQGVLYIRVRAMHFLVCVLILTPAAHTLIAGDGPHAGEIWCAGVLCF